MTKLACPYPWTGGKRRVAHVVWRAFGGVNNYIEPFFGSGAVLLGRPSPGKIETVNDIDGGVVNFWRAIKHDPMEVARWCDWPVSELDLHARHAWLIERLSVMHEQLRADPKFFDAQVAGWWVWGICQWIGTGWCGGIKRGHPRPNLNDGQGVHAPGVWQQRPHVSGTNEGMGVHRKRPDVSGDNPGRGVHRQLPKLSVTDGASGVGGVHRHVTGSSPGKRPHLDNTGNGVHRYALPSIGNDRGINGVAAPPCLEWFTALAERFRRVRIVCGDFRRVLGPSVLGKGRNVGGRRPTGVFLDPPYDDSMRTKRLYTEDETGLSAAVRQWALEHGDDPDLRIALCGYEGEHDMPGSWRVHAWTGARGYARADNENRKKERLWLSPHCLPLETQQPSLFEAT